MSGAEGGSNPLDEFDSVQVARILLRSWCALLKNGGMKNVTTDCAIYTQSRRFCKNAAASAR